MPPPPAWCEDEFGSLRVLHVAGVCCIVSEDWVWVSESRVNVQQRAEGEEPEDGEWNWIGRRGIL